MSEEQPEIQATKSDHSGLVDGKPEGEVIFNVSIPPKAQNFGDGGDVSSATDSSKCEGLAKQPEMAAQDKGLVPSSKHKSRRKRKNLRRREKKEAAKLFGTGSDLTDPNSGKEDGNTGTETEFSQTSEDVTKGNETGNDSELEEMSSICVETSKEPTVTTIPETLEVVNRQTTSSSSKSVHFDEGPPKVVSDVSVEAVPSEEAIFELKLENFNDSTDTRATAAAEDTLITTNASKDTIVLNIGNVGYTDSATSSVASEASAASLLKGNGSSGEEFCETSHHYPSRETMYGQDEKLSSSNVNPEAFREAIQIFKIQNPAEAQQIGSEVDSILSTSMEKVSCLIGTPAPDLNTTFTIEKTGEEDIMAAIRPFSPGQVLPRPIPDIVSDSESMTASASITPRVGEPQLEAVTVDSELEYEGTTPREVEPQQESTEKNLGEKDSELESEETTPREVAPKPEAIIKTFGAVELELESVETNLGEVGPQLEAIEQTPWSVDSEFSSVESTAPSLQVDEPQLEATEKSVCTIDSEVNSAAETLEVGQSQLEAAQKMQYSFDPEIESAAVTFRELEATEQRPCSVDSEFSSVESTVAATLQVGEPQQETTVKNPSVVASESESTTTTPRVGESQLETTIKQASEIDSALDYPLPTPRVSEPQLEKTAVQSPGAVDSELEFASTSDVNHGLMVSAQLPSSASSTKSSVLSPRCIEIETDTNENSLGTVAPLECSKPSTGATTTGESDQTDSEFEDNTETKKSVEVFTLHFPSITDEPPSVNNLDSGNGDQPHFGNGNYRELFPTGSVGGSVLPHSRKHENEVRVDTESDSDYPWLPERKISLLQVIHEKETTEDDASIEVQAGDMLVNRTNATNASQNLINGQHNTGNEDENENDEAREGNKGCCAMCVIA